MNGLLGIGSLVRVKSIDPKVHGLDLDINNPNKLIGLIGVVIDSHPGWPDHIRVKVPEEFTVNSGPITGFPLDTWIFTEDQLELVFTC